MREDTIVATHTNTDFDAFAAMLAARRLYPGSIVCLAGSLNRNVREFYRLHADELDFVVVVGLPPRRIDDGTHAEEVVDEFAHARVNRAETE